MIRATYGHTVEIELDLPTENIPSSLYFPCGPEEVEALLEAGLIPSGRAHVHLSGSIRSAGDAGRVHHDRPVILDVDTARMVASGHTVWHAGVTVYLTEGVEPDFLSIADPNSIPRHGR